MVFLLKISILGIMPVCSKQCISQTCTVSTNVQDCMWHEFDYNS